MKTTAVLVRLVQISFILFRYGLDELVFAISLFRPLRLLVYCNPYYSAKKKQTLGERIRLALENLGPIFVKFGQLLSTRRDLIPEEIADELAKLQDRVPPFPGSQVKDIVESAFKQPLSKIFSEFSTEPLASASVAQVHAATLLTGEDVVVKVLRPGISKRIMRDIDLLYVIADLATRYYSGSRRFKPREVIAEFDAFLHGELDLLREAANASQLRRNFMDSDMLYIPEVYWKYTCRNVLVMERIYGIPVSDISALKKRGIHLGELARRGVEIFFTQVFRDCFFHADMHPGNIFVAPDKKDKPQYLGVDFGIMGSLNPEDQRYLAENLMAFFKRDYRRVAQLHVESGWVSADTRVNEFEADIRTVCEPIFERPLKEISFGKLLLRLFQTARRFNMEVQPQLILLQKTLFNVEGLGRQLHPDLDLWGTAKPFLERWLKSRLGYRAFFYKLREYAPFYLEKLPELPDLVYQTLLEVHRKQRSTDMDVPKSAPKERSRLWKKCSWIVLGVGVACIVWALLGLTGDELLYRLSTKDLLILGFSGLGLLISAMIFLESA